MILPRAIDKLPKWTDESQSRYMLGCVRLRRSSDTIFAEATDGRRLCRLTWPCIGEDREYFLPGKAFSQALRAAKPGPDGYGAGAGDQGVALYSGTSITNVQTRGDGRWPRTEDVLYPPAQAKASSVATQPLLAEARTALKQGANPFGHRPMALEFGGVKVRLDAKYVRDMADMAIRCGYDDVHVSATNGQSAVHFWAYTEVKFEAVIMPLAAD
jgi:hypothetical protein